jgi:hypothetical protein
MTSNPTKTMGIRRVLIPLLGAAVCMALLFEARAAGHSEFVAQLEARAVSVSGIDDDAGRVDILIQRWSGDEDLKRLRDALLRGDSPQLLAALHLQPRRVGIVLMPGVQGHGARARTRTPRNLLFARQAIGPTGRQVIAVSAEHLGLGEPAIDARRSVPEFNLIEIRLEPGGNGIGKVAGAADVTFSSELGTLAVKDFRKHPVRLVDVRISQP